MIHSGCEQCHTNDTLLMLMEPPPHSKLYWPELDRIQKSVNCQTETEGYTWPNCCASTQSCCPSPSQFSPFLQLHNFVHYKVWDTQGGSDSHLLQAVSAFLLHLLEMTWPVGQKWADWSTEGREALNQWEMICLMTGEKIHFLRQTQLLTSWCSSSAAEVFFLSQYPERMHVNETFLFSFLSVMYALQPDSTRGTQLLYSRPTALKTFRYFFFTTRKLFKLPVWDAFHFTECVLLEQWCLGVLIPSGWHSQ